MRWIQSSTAAPWAWLVLQSLLFCGCSPSIESIVEKHRGAVEVRLTQVAAISMLVDDSDVNEGVGFEGITLDFQQMENFALRPSWNTAVIHAERLKDLTGYNEELGVVIGESYFLSHAQQSLDGDGWAMSDIAESVEGELLRASQLRYLFVLREIEHKRPRSLDGEDFIGGHYRADAICYDLEAGVQLGGFEFQAGNSEAGSFNYTTSKFNVHGNRDWQKLRAIQDDLRKNAEDAFWAAVAATIPGSERPRY